MASVLPSTMLSAPTPVWQTSARPSPTRSTLRGSGRHRIERTTRPARTSTTARRASPSHVATASSGGAARAASGPNRTVAAARPRKRRRSMTLLRPGRPERSFAAREAAGMVAPPCRSASPRRSSRTSTGSRSHPPARSSSSMPGTTSQSRRAQATAARSATSRTNASAPGSSPSTTSGGGASCCSRCMRHLEEVLSGRVSLLMSSRLQIAASVEEADLVIGAVLIPGALAPKLVTREMIAGMKAGAVVVDVAIDQGGCFETSHPTTHSDPVYVDEGVTHYCVANMPGGVPITATKALTNATLPYVEAIAGLGLREAVAADPELAKGVNVLAGKITYEAVAEAHGLDYTPLDDALALSA